MRPATAVFDYWESGKALIDAMLDTHSNRQTLAAEVKARMRALISHARFHSPFYGRLYGSWHDRFNPELRDLPHVTKSQLMGAFDDWVTDRGVTREGVEAFLRSGSHVGHAYLGRYAVWTSSGTSGEPAVFLHDTRALAVYDALEAVRFRRLESPFALMASLWDSERYALVAAEGHFAGNAALARIRLLNPNLAPRVRFFSIMEAVESLTGSLNSFRPTRLATYPSCALVLAREIDGGRLRISPDELWLGGESCSEGEKSLLRQAFRCRVRDDYGASEFPPIGFDCQKGALHLNADWAILEPVDREYRPVQPGERSHSVLLTNLANFIQPIIRYDLGDSVTLLPEPCSCGSPFPAMLVEGRRDDILTLRAADGTEVPLLPLALGTVLEEEAGIFRFQLIQTGPAAVSIRLGIPAEQQDPWQRAETALRRYLRAQGLGAVQLERDAKPLRHDVRSGKLRRIYAQGSCPLGTTSARSSK